MLREYQQRISQCIAQRVECMIICLLGLSYGMPTQCIKLLELKTQECSLEAKVADLEKQRKTSERYRWDFQEQNVLGKVSLRNGSHLLNRQWNTPLGGIPSLRDELISFHTEDMPPRERVS